MSDHVSPVSLYLTIFGALMLLTGVTVAAAYVDLGQFNFAVAMLIAGFKASLVVWYFMHVKYQSHLTKLTVATGLFFLTILLGMSLIDYVSRDDFSGRRPQPVGPDAVIEQARPAAQPRH
jgi:cytochrome c oxidase subunit IV